MAIIVRAVDGVSGIPAGFPILLDDGMAIIEPAFAFLLELATVPGRSHSPETLRTYAEHLYDWFDSLDQSALDWRDAGEETVAAYRNRMLEQPSAHTGRPFARSTINDRVRSVCRFYGWAHRRGWIPELPFQTLAEALERLAQEFQLSDDERAGCTTESAGQPPTSRRRACSRPLGRDASN
jgi:site-specific recombinase XerD